MTDSILDTIKQMLGIPSSDTSFDTDIIVHINSVFMTLNQLGIGDDETVFSISDKTTEWSSFSSDISNYSELKSYIYLKVRLLFDPPGTSFLIDSMRKAIEESEWRLMIQVPIPEDPVVPEE